MKNRFLDRVTELKKRGVSREEALSRDIDPVSQDWEQAVQQVYGPASSGEDYLSGIKKVFGKA